MQFLFIQCRVLLEYVLLLFVPCASVLFIDCHSVQYSLLCIVAGVDVARMINWAQSLEDTDNTENNN